MNNIAAQLLEKLIEVVVQEAAKRLKNSETRPAEPNEPLIEDKTQTALLLETSVSAEKEITKQDVQRAITALWQTDNGSQKVKDLYKTFDIVNISGLPENKYAEFKNYIGNHYGV